MSARLKRPRALTDLIALLDETGWSYAVEQAKDSGGAPYITVRGKPAWDNFTEIRATWHSRDTGTLRLVSCIACQLRRDWHHLPLKAARELIQPEVEEAGDDPR